MSDIVKRLKLKEDAGLEYTPTELTYELRKAVAGHKKDEFLSWGYQWEDKPHRLVYAACCEAEWAADEIERLRAALRPFAKAADGFDMQPINNPEEWFAYGGISSRHETVGAITVGDLRRARAVLRVNNMDVDSSATS